MQGPARRRAGSIDQRSLAELFEYRRLLKSIGRRANELSQSICELHDAKAEVELGELVYRIVTVDRRSMTEKNLIPILGWRELERIRREIAPTHFRRLLVSPAYRPEDESRDHD